MLKASRVSAVITAYHSAHLLRRCVESVLAQSVSPCEVIVVDDASSDNPQGVLEQFGRAVTLLRRPKNGGPAAARNTGIGAASGEWIAFLDADDRWLPSKIERQMEIAAEHPEAAVIFGDCIQLDADGKPMATYLSDKQPQSGKILDALIDHIFILPSATMLRRDALLSVGCFDDESLRGAEDHDLCLRLATTGYSFEFAPEPVALYQRQPQSISRNHLEMLRCQVKVWNRLLKRELTVDQRRRVLLKLAEIRFELAYRLRRNARMESIREARRVVACHPAKIAGWKLLASNLVLAALPGEHGKV